MFRKNLSDLVKGIRNNRKGDAQFISAAIAECKEELKKNDPYAAAAARKTTSPPH